MTQVERIDEEEEPQVRLVLVEVVDFYFCTNRKLYLS